MMHLINQSPFQAIAVPSICHEDKHHVVVVIKGTFGIGDPEQGVFISGKQEKVNLEDVYWGEPGKFSLKYESDLAISKPGTDVALIGKARSPRGAVKQLDVSLRAGPLHKVIRVFGNRYWEKTGTGWKMTEPEPFESMPLVYEFAYGGTDPWQKPDELPDTDMRNPVGRGYGSKQSHRATKQIKLPNLELPDQLITDLRQQPEPAGFGFVARNWLPRSALLGTYDEAWEKERNPLLPEDFDPLSYSAASPGLRSDEHFIGGEQVVIDNVSASGQLSFTLPQNQIKVITYINEQRTEHPTKLDTVIIEPGRKRVMLSWRVAIPCHWNLSMIEWIKVMEVK